MTPELQALIDAAQAKTAALELKLAKLESDFQAQHRAFDDFIGYVKLSPAQAGGVLDVLPQALARLPLKPHKIGKSVTYQAREVLDYRESRRVK